ncbi:hypothetical protein Taro_001591 [Colocasia esculenta]|uniref:Uncharacterized protein n=1 Tax=Colocasia esculenta TaxID=4460 RepID=A0A843TGF4_COLES|nr:hypothetical protein [Colocasia esculenta]
MKPITSLGAIPGALGVVNAPGVVNAIVACEPELEAQDNTLCHIVNHTHENKMRGEVHSISRELQWYKQLVGHVRIHGLRRFIEALEKKVASLPIRNDRYPQSLIVANESFNK